MYSRSRIWKHLGTLISEWQLLNFRYFTLKTSSPHSYTKKLENWTRSQDLCYDCRDPRVAVLRPPSHLRSSKSQTTLSRHVANTTTGPSAVEEKAVALLNHLNWYVLSAGAALLSFLPYWACLFTCSHQALVHFLFSLWLGISLTKLPVSSTPLVNSGSASELLWQTIFFPQSLRRKPSILYADLATFCYMLWTHISQHSYFLCSVVCLYFMFSFIWKIQTAWFSFEVKNCQFI